ncbi:MAG: LCP family protein, partial [Acidimicrobiia bacterium]|nr:LCP family protein [Acidimicrobiia bacterium]
MTNLDAGRPDLGFAARFWESFIVQWLLTHRLRALTIVLLGALVGTSTYVAVVSAGGLRDIATEDFDPAAAAAALAAMSAAQADAQLDEVYAPDLASLEDSEARKLQLISDEEELARQLRLMATGEADDFSSEYVAGTPVPDSMFNTVLLIGADESGYLADVIIYILIPSDGSAPLMASLPRDLYLPNRCSRSFARINESLGGCPGVASGAELLALTVSDFTGVEVDHYARVNFAGFRNVVDWMGGVTVCVDYPTRDPKSRLDIPAGCSTVGGEQALAWVRSRSAAEQLIDGVWKPAGVSDFQRQRRQQAVLFQFARKLAAYTSVGSLSTALQNLSSAV